MMVIIYSHKLFGFMILMDCSASLSSPLSNIFNAYKMLR